MRPFGASYFPVKFRTRGADGRQVRRQTAWLLPMCKLLDDCVSTDERRATVEDLAAHVARLSATCGAPPGLEGVIHLSHSGGSHRHYGEAIRVEHVRGFCPLWPRMRAGGFAPFDPQWGLALAALAQLAPAPKPPPLHECS